MPISPFNVVLSTDNLNTGRSRWNSQLESLRTTYNSLEVTVTNNTNNINSNNSVIFQNSSAIQDNTNNIASQLNLINNNSADISTNASNITTLQNRAINTTHSLTGGGNLTANRTLQLVNDLAAPGSEKVYGTNSSGVKGWYDLGSNIVANNIERAITQVGHGFSVGDIIQHNGTAYALASSDTEFDSEVIGIVSGVTDTDNFTLTYGGRVSGLSGLTAGTTYFLNSAGGLSATSGVVSKPLLISTSTTDGVFFNFRGAVEDDMIADEFTYSSTGNTIATGIGSNLSFPIPYNRLLGVSVELTGLTAGQTATVDFFGDSARTELQYSVDFTDTITVENTESWRYRSLALDNTAYIKITNTSGAQITVDLNIVAEPF